MLAFAVYLLLTIIFIFTDQDVPVLALISMKLGGASDSTKDWDPWPVRLFTVGIMLIHLSQTVFIMYHKDTLKVNTSKTIRSCAIHHLIAFSIVSLCFFVINIIYLITNVKDMQISPYILSGFLIVIIAVQTIVFVLFYKLADQSVTQMLKFHEYLVNYRLTPRSRIMKKHMPKMEAIYEQESAFESSSVLMSQGPVAMSSYSKTTTKFRYKPQNSNDFEEPVEESSDSDEEEIDVKLEHEIIEDINRQFTRS